MQLQQSQQLRLQLATQIADLYRCQLFLPGALKLWTLTSSSISIAIFARRGFGLDWIRLGTKLPAELVSSQVASCKLLVDSCNLQRSIQPCTWHRCWCCAGQQVIQLLARKLLLFVPRPGRLDAKLGQISLASCSLLANYN